MKRLVKPSAVSGVVTAPPSKSVAQRAIAIASIAKGKSEILFPGNSDDVKAIINVCKTLGSEINELADKLIISGGISTPKKPLNCGESGLAIRMMSPIAAFLSSPVTLIGSGTLISRPMEIVEQSICAMGAKCKTNNGFLPVTVEGPIQGGVAEIDGSISSQVLTGMLIASPLAKNDVTIHVKNLQSKPYIDLTIEVMKLFGVEVLNENYKTFKIQHEVHYKPTKFTVEGDWSSAAFLLVAGSIAGKVRVENLLPASKQADRAILEVLFQAGAKVSIYDNAVEVCKHELNAFHFDATNCPDLFPPLVALAAHCHGESRILGVSRLRVKESDRAVALQQEFSKIGVEIKISGELMQVFGTKVRGGKVHSHGDHRIVMACAVAALAAEGEVEIDGSGAVSKSYPQFFENLEKISNS